MSTRPLDELNRDPYKAYEITRDKHIDLEVYFSTTSLEAAVAAGQSVLQAIGNALDRLAADGKLSASDHYAAAELSAYRNDPEVLAQLASCGQQSGDAGFNIFDWLITPAYADATSCLISAGGKTYTITPSGALSCLELFLKVTQVATSQASAATAAATMALASVFLLASAGPAGAAVDEKTTLRDGTIMHLTGQEGELKRNVLIALPNGQNVSLVLNINESGNYDLVAGQVLGGPMPSSLLADIAKQLSHSGNTIVYNQTPGKGHNGGPPLDDDGPSNGNSPDPNDNKPLAPPIIPGMQIDYDTISTAKPGQATSPRNLAEQVLWNQVIDNPANGSKLTGLNNDPRFPVSNGWQKMEVTHTRPDGTKISILYQYNSTTGKAYDMKFTN